MRSLSSTWTHSRPSPEPVTAPAACQDAPPSVVTAMVSAAPTAQPYRPVFSKWIAYPTPPMMVPSSCSVQVSPASSEKLISPPVEPTIQMCRSSSANMAAPNPGPQPAAPRPTFTTAAQVPPPSSV